MGIVQMNSRMGLAKAIKQVRSVRGLTQEDFGDISSRTYLSTLERGLKSPTLDKIIELSAKMEIHPLTLLTLTFIKEGDDLNHLFERIKSELSVCM